MKEKDSTGKKRSKPRKIHPDQSDNIAEWAINELRRLSKFETESRKRMMESRKLIR